ncbi:MAG: hypothetical protein AB8D52_02780 [Gammaproteobacteria bacterium]
MNLSKSFTKTIFTVSVLTGLTLASTAQATTYTYDDKNSAVTKNTTPLVLHKNAGDISAVNTSFDSDTNAFSMKYTVNSNGSALANGMTLVLGSGNSGSNFAMLYADSKSGNISAYKYAGKNSYANSAFIESFGGKFETDTSIANQTTFSFDIDASKINNFAGGDWTGLGFGETMGIWLYAVKTDGDPTYNANGSLASFGYSNSGWSTYDSRMNGLRAQVSNPPLTPPVPPVNVSESGTLALASIGLFGMVARRRFKKQSDK